MSVVGFVEVDEVEGEEAREHMLVINIECEADSEAPPLIQRRLLMEDVHESKHRFLQSDRYRSLCDLEGLIEPSKKRKRQNSTITQAKKSSPAISLAPLPGYRPKYAFMPAAVIASGPRLRTPNHCHAKNACSTRCCQLPNRLRRPRLPPSHRCARTSRNCGSFVSLSMWLTRTCLR